MKIIEKDDKNKSVTVKMNLDEALVIFGTTYICAKDPSGNQVFENIGAFNRELGAFLLEQNPEVRERFEELDRIWCESMRLESENTL